MKNKDFRLIGILITAGILLVVAGSGYYYTQVKPENIISGYHEYDLNKETEEEAKDMVDEKRVVFKGKESFVKIEGPNSYVILDENSKEIVVDERNTFGGNIVSRGTFNKLNFSPKGSYLTYSSTGWEYEGKNIYDIEKKEKVATFPMSNFLEFTSDEKFLITCASSPMAGDYYGKVLTLPDFREIYDIFKNGETLEYMTLDCEIDKENKIVKYNLSDYYGDEDSSDNQEKIIEYSLELRDVIR